MALRARAITIVDIPNLLFGCWTDNVNKTGCSVILAPTGAVASACFTGFAPAVYESEILNPKNPNPLIHGLVLTGGSAFGLASCVGVTQYLKSIGVGLDTGDTKVPIVTGAAIYDYPYNLSKGTLPDANSGYAAAEKAAMVTLGKTPGSGPVSVSPPESGPFGPGISARAGKIGEPDLSSQSGVGHYGFEFDDLQVAAMAVVNPMGSIVNPLDGKIISGLRTPDGRLADHYDILETLKKRLSNDSKLFRKNTVLVVVATNAALTKTDAHRLAIMASHGISRAIFPAGTYFDGDAIFFLSSQTGPPAEMAYLGALAAEAVSLAILKSIVVGPPTIKKKTQRRPKHWAYLH